MDTQTRKSPVACGCCCGDIADEIASEVCACKLCGCTDPLGRARRDAEELPPYGLMLFARRTAEPPETHARSVA